ncbi:MAG: hypothetical protein WCI79_02760 [Candidatus Saccharibacteria bacterium]
MTLSRVIIIALFVLLAAVMKFSFYIYAAFFGVWALFELSIFLKRGIHSERYKVVISTITTIVTIALQYPH